MQSLAERSATLARRFNPDLLQRRLTVFQFHFNRGEPFYLTVTPSSFEFSEGMIPTPTISLFIDTHDTCWRLLEGTLDGMSAFVEGRYSADGNIVLSQLLLFLFRSGNPALAWEIQQ